MTLCELVGIILTLALVIYVKIMMERRPEALGEDNYMFLREI
jgi:hypothetical protein